MNAHILVVDDDPVIRDVLAFNLSSEGYHISVAASAEEAEAQMDENDSIDLILLDVMMTGVSGFSFARKLRSQSISTPIIFITAKETEQDLLTGFSVGGDDYICKPFSMREVQARVKAILSRVHTSSIYALDGLKINLESKETEVDGQSVDLTKTEFKLLAFLMQHKGRVLSREIILDNVWPKSVYVSERTVDVHIARLRKKIGDYAACINNRSGFGYVFDHAANEENS